MGKNFIIAPTDDPNVAAAKAFSRPNQSSYDSMFSWLFDSIVLQFYDSMNTSTHWLKGHAGKLVQL